MNDNTLLILGALGLGAFWLVTSRPVMPAGTAAPANTSQGDPYAAYLAGMQAGAQSNTPRDPGDVNNWAAFGTALVGAIGSTVNTALQSSNTGNTSSSTPSGWVEPDWNA